jgi:hypothetical protein
MSARLRYEIDELPEIMTATLGEMRNELSVGIVSGGVRHRNFELHDFLSKHDFEIADLNDKRKARSTLAKAENVLCILVKQVGPVSFESMSIDERRAFLSTMTMGDVIQMYIALRRLSLGNKFVYPYDCPGCSTEEKPYRLEPEFDLDEIEILTLEEAPGKPLPTQIAWHVPLKDGITLTRGGKTIKATGIWMRIIPWGAVSRLPGMPGNGARRREMLRYAILDTEPSSSVKGEPLYIHDEELGLFSEYDLKHIEWVYENYSPGVFLSLTTPPCTNADCRLQIRQPLIWDFDSFFAYSAPQLQRKRKFSKSSSSSPSQPKVPSNGQTSPVV